MTYEQIVGWLTGLGANDAESGGAAFQFDNSLEILVELSDDHLALMFYADVGRLEAGAPASVLARLLRLDFLGVGTDGAALSLADDGQTLALWRSMPLVSLSPDTLDDVMGGFLDAALQTRSTIAGLLEDDLSGHAAPPLHGMYRV